MLAGVSSLTIVVGSIVFGIAFHRSAAWRPLTRFSFAVAIGFAILGPLAAIATVTRSDVAGLVERGPMVIFIGWLLVVGCFALRRDGSLTRRPT